jgi:Flp pilus assembly protein TadB/Mg-chelatase subunit ChlD
VSRLAVAAAVSAACVVTLASPAAAATELVVSDLHVDAAVRSVDFTVSATDLPPGGGLDPASIVATVDGRTLPTASVTVDETREVEAPRVLLVVDTSGSMVGQPMTEAKQALASFVSQAAADVQLGLLSFSTSPQLLVAPTLDRPGLLAAVTGLEAQGETSLYDAVIAGVAALGPTGDRRVVVLSDGADTRSTAPLEQALAATRDSGVKVDAIGFNTGESVQAVLAQIASTGRGQVYAAASSAELMSALASTVREQATALDVRVLIPENVRGEQTLSVTAATEQGAVTTTTPARLGNLTAAAAPRTGWWGTRGALLTGLAAIGVSLALLGLALFGGGRRGQRQTHDLLERFTTTPTTSKPDVRTASPVARTALELADRVVTKRNSRDKATLRLARAAVAFTPAEWLLLQAGASLGLTLLLVLLGWNLLLAVVVGTALGVFGPSRYLAFRGGRRRKAFEDKLPDALQMTAGSLTAGYSLAQALDGIVREGSEPMATEIGKALAESRLGVPVESTLESVAERMGSKDFGWVVMAIRVQREVGGNLGGVLTTVSATMRERAMLRRHVRGLSAEGRLSAYILIGLPISLVLFMYTARREYLEPLYTTGLGLGLIAAAVLLMSIGSFVMSRMVKVEV